MTMNPFNSTNFIKALKERYDAIPIIQGDKAAKVMVANAIKSHKFNPADVLSFICSELGNPSVKLGKDDWKDIIKKAIKRGGLVGKCLEACASVLKGKDKVSNEDLFSAVVSACGENPELLLSELYLNKVGWMKVVDTLVKVEVEETVETAMSEVTVETVKVETTKAGKKAAKVSKMNPRCKSIILVKDGVKKEWASYRDCEKELGAGFGTVSQHLSGKLKSVKGWVLYKEEDRGDRVLAIQIGLHFILGEAIGVHQDAESLLHLVGPLDSHFPLIFAALLHLLIDRDHQRFIASLQVIVGHSRDIHRGSFSASQPSRPSPRQHLIQ